MKVIEKQHLVKIEGEVEVKKFGFIFNAKMVQLLSDNLYQDKVLAIVRELSTNAYDSQVENGTADKPFDVHLPTWNESFFFIRDYGTGMSPERVDNIYRHYGGSDRTESNEFVGGMGLGSKTPFCYHTKTFTIDVWYNKIHYCYSAYIGEDGIPCIAKMSEGPSNEHSGVRIKIPVKQYDERAFNRAAELVYKYFPVKPNISGSSINIQKPQYILEGDDGEWKLRKDGDGCRVIMGNIAYPVKFDDGNLTIAQRSVMSSAFDIFAEIGSLSVEIGREGLSYDNRTKTRIRHYINNIINDFNAKIQKEIIVTKNLWEARKKYYELYKATEIKIADPSKLEYNGVKLFDGNCNNTVSLEQFIKNDSLEMYSFSTNSWRNSVEKKRVNSLSVRNQYLFYENDLNVGAFVRASSVAKQNIDKIIVLFKFKNASDRANILNHIGCDDSYFIKISTVPSPTVRASSGPRGNIGQVLSFRADCNKNCDTMSNFWESEKNIDFDTDSGVYVEFNRFSFRNNRGAMSSPGELTSFIAHCNNIGITIPTIYGIKTADIPKVSKNKNWTNLFNWVLPQLINIVAKYDVEEIQFYQNQLRLVGRNMYVGSRYMYRMDAENVVKLGNMCSTKGVFTAFSEAVKHALSKSVDSSFIHSLTTLMSLFGQNMPKSIFAKPQLSLDKMEHEVYNKYGLLEEIRDLNGLTVAKLKLVANYIDSVN